MTRGTPLGSSGGNTQASRVVEEHENRAARGRKKALLQGELPAKKKRAAHDVPPRRAGYAVKQKRPQRAAPL